MSRPRMCPLVGPRWSSSRPKCQARTTSSTTASADSKKAQRRRSKWMVRPIRKCSTRPGPARRAAADTRRGRVMSDLSLLINDHLVRDALRQVIDPELGENLVDLGLIYGITIEDKSVVVDLTLT